MFVILSERYLSSVSLTAYGVKRPPDTQGPILLVIVADQCFAHTSTLVMLCGM